MLILNKIIKKKKKVKKKIISSVVVFFGGGLLWLFQITRDTLCFLCLRDVLVNAENFFQLWLGENFESGTRAPVGSQKNDVQSFPKVLFLLIPY